MLNRFLVEQLKALLIQLFPKWSFKKCVESISEIDLRKHPGWPVLLQLVHCPMQQLQPRETCRGRLNDMTFAGVSCKKNELLWWCLFKWSMKTKKHCVCLFVFLLGVYIALLPWIVLFTMRIPINQPVSIVSWNKGCFCTAQVTRSSSTSKSRKRVSNKKTFFFSKFSYLPEI